MSWTIIEKELDLFRARLRATACGWKFITLTASMTFSLAFGDTGPLLLTTRDTVLLEEFTEPGDILYRDAHLPPGNWNRSQPTKT